MPMSQKISMSSVRIKASVSRCFSKAAVKRDKTKLVFGKRDLARKFSANAVPFTTERLFIPTWMDALEESQFTDSGEMHFLAASHPHIETEWLLNSGNFCNHHSNALAKRLNESKATLSYLIERTNLSQTDSDFVYVDLLLKSDSRQQVKLLVDSRDVIGLSQGSGFILCSIDSIVTRSVLNTKEPMCDSLLFHDLTESLLSGSPIEISCRKCGTRLSWTEHMIPKLMFSGKCTQKTYSELNPGSGMHYRGPIVPNLRNVWAGVIETISQKKGDEISILSAIVFQVFKDPSSGRSRKVQLPSPDPCVQWTLLPFRSPIHSGAS
jgi:hypothetical protein